MNLNVSPSLRKFNERYYFAGKYITDDELYNLLTEVEKYLEDFSSLIRHSEEITEKIVKVKNILVENNKKNKKIMIFGNGGSAAIASHFSVDLTKNAGLRCVNYNEADLITCFANDYGHENWVKEAIKAYCFINDLLILISSEKTFV